MTRAPRSSATDELARAIRRSRLLDPLLRDQWLRVLPYLTPAHRQRLQAILSAGESSCNLADAETHDRVADHGT